MKKKTDLGIRLDHLEKQKSARSFARQKENKQHS